MTSAQILLENVAICLLVPIALRQVQGAVVRRLDNRRMYHILFCRLLPIICGVLIALCMIVQTGTARSFRVDTLWSLTGPFHESRLWVLIGDQIGTPWAGPGIGPVGPIVATAYALVAGLTLVNAVIAMVGWRSLGALRGIAVHVISTLVTAVYVTFLLITVAWVVHWLNFWIFAVLMLLIEMRRREERGVRLSF